LLISLLWALALVPIYVNLARRFGQVDHPNGRNKSHSIAQPTSGGLVIFIAVVAGMMTTALLGSTELLLSVRENTGLMLAGAWIVFFGAIDDRNGLRVRQKFVIQLLAALIVVWSGTRISSLAMLGSSISLGPLSVPLTLLWFLVSMNAMKFLDGADGFAATVGIVIATTLGLTALLLGSPQDAAIAFAVCGALAGFLVYNFPPSKVFMGDAGSMLVGLLLGSLAIQGNLKGPATLTMLIPLTIFLIPILDTSAAVIRRVLSGKQLAAGDRQHLHHLLEGQGYGPRAKLVMLVLLCGIPAAGSLLSVAFANSIFAVAGVLIVVAILWSNDLFGSNELALIGSRLQMMIKSLLPTRVTNAQQFQVGLRESRDIRQMCRLLRAFVNQHELAFARLELEQLGKPAPLMWEHNFDANQHCTWRNRIPLAAEDDDLGYVELAGELTSKEAMRLFGPTSELLEQLQPFLVDFRQQQRAAIQYEEDVAVHESPASLFPERFSFEQAEIAGLKFDFVRAAEVVKVVERWRRNGERDCVTLSNPTSVMACHRDEAMKAATSEAGLTLPDGVGILMAAKMLGYGRCHRVGGPTLMLELCDAGRAHNYRHFFYGGAAGIPEKLEEKLTEKFPGLNVVGSYSPPFRPLTPEEDEQIIDRINAAKPDIVWVGLGAPKQEIWMHAHRHGLDATALIGVGAAFDFHSGNVKWAPWIVRKTGTEWAFRLLTNPKRMWRRNFIDSPQFLLRVFAQLRSRWSRQLQGKPAVPRFRLVTWDTSNLRRDQANRLSPATSSFAEVEPQLTNEDRPVS
jgi:UDP-GlcNAc:undecaprenyl-phosphate GlcNAc-1-phosphate transferase